MKALLRWWERAAIFVWTLVELDRQKASSGGALLGAAGIAFRFQKFGRSCMR